MLDVESSLVEMESLRLIERVVGEGYVYGRFQKVVAKEAMMSRLSQQLPGAVVGTQGTVWTLRS